MGVFPAGSAPLAVGFGHALGPPPAPGTRPCTPWRFPHPHGWGRLAAFVLGRSPCHLLGRDRRRPQLPGGELRRARRRLPAGGDRRGVPLRSARGHPHGERGHGGVRRRDPAPDDFETPDARVWLLFAALLLSGVAVAELAARERRRSEQAYEREREAALLAGLSSALVGGASLELAQIDAARVAAAAIGAPAARIVFGRGPLAGQVALPLDVDGRVIGRLELMGERCRRSATRRAARGALAGGRPGARAGARAPRPRGCRGTGAAGVRCPQDRAAARRLARAAQPLTAIKAAVGALRGDQVQLGEEAVHELLEDVSTETDRLDRLVSDLLDVSRLQAGSASTALDWCEVDDLVRGAVAAARSRARGAGEVEIDEELPLVHCDATQIERVLVNLIENAAKFSPADEPVVVRARAGRATTWRSR